MQQLQRLWQKVDLFRWSLLLWICLFLHFSLYSIASLFGASSPWDREAFFAIQLLLILLFCFILSRISVALKLYLTPAKGPARTLLKLRLPLLVGVVCLFLLCLNIALLSRWGYVSFFVLYIVWPSMLFGFLLVVGFLFVRLARAHEQTQGLLHNLEVAHKQLADYSVRIEELTLSTERRRMARELHDTLAQGLAGLILQLEAVKSHLVSGNDERALQIVTQAMGRARSSLTAARSAIDDLRGESIPSVDLQQTLEDEIERFSTATGIPCITGLSVLAIVPDELSEAIVRIVAEGLMNVAQHARARQVWVSVTRQDYEIAIEIRDNGMGFDPSTMIGQGHYGLIGLRERARLLGGQFTLTSVPGEGTTLRLLLPTDRCGGAV